MLLSFAQFEREIAGERIRDKIAASKAKGMWMGGNVPLGYDINERKLIVNAAEAETVRGIFQRYAELASVKLLRAELERLGIVSKRREGASGKLSGGQAFSRGALYLMLQNRIYRGEIAHQGNVYPGQHVAIVAPELWQIVEKKLAANRQDRSSGAGAEAPSLLAGLIVDAEGHRMTPTHAVKTGKCYRYYVSAPLITGEGAQPGKGRRIPAGDIEDLVLDRLRAFFASATAIGEALAPLDLDVATLEAVLGRAAQLAKDWSVRPPIELRALARSVIAQVAVGDNGITLQLDQHRLLASLTPGAPQTQQPAVAPIELTIDARLRRAGKGTRLVIGDGTAQAIDPRLSSLIGQAIATRQDLLPDGDDSIDAMAKRRGVRGDHLTTLVRLSYLAPEIAGAILAGRQPVELSAKRLMALSRDLPHDWRQQRQHLGFPAA